MSKLRQLENEFKNGLIKKEDYIRTMHDLHMVLWDYFDFIQDKNIDSIEISREQILLKTKAGIKMVCDAEDERIIPIEILNFGDYETDEIQMIRRFLKKDSVIIDIGAHIGWYCLNLAKSLPEGRIIAFEPIPRTYEHLKKNIAINGVKNVELYNFGFSDKEEELPFYYDPKLSVAASLRNLHEDREKIMIKCVMKRMDDFIDKVTSKIDFIKCDVEGAEILVIKGGLKTISKTLPVMFLEMLRKWSAKYGYHPNEIIKILSDIGYECYYINDAKLVNIKEIDEETIATNFYFIHPKKHNSLLRCLV